MKNRTIIGIICMIAAVAITFAAGPLVNRMTADTTVVLRLKEDVNQGAQLTEDHLEEVKVNTAALPAGVLTDAAQIVGKYAVSNLYAGDCLTEDKISDNADSAEDIFASLDGNKIAVSVPIPTFAAGLSGKLQNGDIISLIFVDKDGNESVIPPELQYVKVITATTAGGIDKEDIIKNEDGSFEIPSTVTVLVNSEQALLLAKYEAEGKIQAALVFRGEKEKADEFLAKQDSVFASPAQPQKNGGGDNG